MSSIPDQNNKLSEDKPSQNPTRPKAMRICYRTRLQPLRADQERVLHLSSHTGLIRCCQDIPWQILEADRVAFNTKLHRTQEDTNSLLTIAYTL